MSDPIEALDGVSDAPLDERYHVVRDRVIQEFEKQYLLRLMDRTRGNLTEAARIAAVNRTTLYRMMERNGLQRAPSLGWLVPCPSFAGAESSEPCAHLSLAASSSPLPRVVDRPAPSNPPPPIPATYRPTL